MLRAACNVMFVNIPGDFSVRIILISIFAPVFGRLLIEPLWSRFNRTFTELKQEETSVDKQSILRNCGFKRT